MSNRIGDRVHDINHGYGRLLVPWRGGSWLAWRSYRDGNASSSVRGGVYVHEPRRGAFRIFAAFHNVSAETRSISIQGERVVLDPVGRPSVPKREIRRAVYTLIDGKEPPGPDYVPPPPKPLVGGRDC